MAISLELGKLVTVSFIYRYWESISKVLRGYMIIGAIVLSSITSLGIYGFLSAGYAAGAVDINQKSNQIELYTTQQKSIESTIQSNDKRLDQLQNIRTKQESRLDSLVGKQGFITQQKTGQGVDQEIRQLQKEQLSLRTRRDSLENEKTKTTGSIQTGSKIGTFWYISKALGIPLDTIVKWFILAIVLVFDPLAVALVLAYNVIVKKTPTIPFDDSIPSEPSSSLPITDEASGELLDPQKGLSESIEEPIPGQEPQKGLSQELEWHIDPNNVHLQRNQAPAH